MAIVTIKSHQPLDKTGQKMPVTVPFRALFHVETAFFTHTAQQTNGGVSFS